MNKRELMEKVWEERGVKRGEGSVGVDRVLEWIEEGVEKGENVEVIGLG
ncbi:HU family DNA-binding protein [Bacillus thuringiensis]|nr:HU family DNA-binding protein [Bacillus thuringiensis]